MICRRRRRQRHDIQLLPRYSAIDIIAIILLRYWWWERYFIDTAYALFSLFHYARYAMPLLICRHIAVLFRHITPLRRAAATLSCWCHYRLRHYYADYACALPCRLIATPYAASLPLLRQAFFSQLCRFSSAADNTPRDTLADVTLPCHYLLLMFHIYACCQRTLHYRRYSAAILHITPPLRCFSPFSILRYAIIRYALLYAITLIFAIVDSHYAITLPRQDACYYTYYCYGAAMLLPLRFLLITLMIIITLITPRVTLHIRQLFIIAISYATYIL